MKTKQGHEVGSKEHARAIDDAVAGRNYMVHAVYLYGCRPCKKLVPIYLGVGVEGPQELRDSGLYIPSPFMGPRCESCGGETSHVMFGADEHFAPRYPKIGATCFVIPTSGIDMKYFCSGVFCGKTIKANKVRP
jgi:hypothetical protein